MGSKLAGPAGQGGKTIAQNADINVTPFVDIMLVLLIIFMVAAPMATVSIKLDLPPATPPVDCRQERVFVRAQPEVKYNAFMEVMNKLQEKGFYKVGLLNEDIT